ncbi:MAG: sulfotransferase [Acidobacteria bacterium]|uniref:Sulfotransferase n=1 Tax=Candidatus Polarisedimenticola svalbardensis TaxID=2886004 RepID=A0A8J6Y3X2_9BACT|nr:sulfotransferase [Candidatus Polarisedimenticola svalbardensis]
MKLEQPIFIIGIGRSGSTVVHNILAHHPNLSWLSAVGKRYPAKPGRNRMLMQALDVPVLGSMLAKRFTPWECFDFWEHHAKGFRRTCRDLVPGDVTERNKKKMRKVLAELTTPKRNRLMFKATGWPRIGYLREIFPDARFIHVLRDGRAVVNSMINVGWWLGYQGPQNWRWGELNEEHKAEWERHNRSYVALAAIQWKIAMEAVEQGRQYLGDDQFFELRYETLLSDPVNTMRRVLEFAGLPWRDSFQRSVESYGLRNMNVRWTSELTVDQQQTVQDVLAPALHRLNYE